MKPMPAFPLRAAALLALAAQSTAATAQMQPPLALPYPVTHHEIYDPSFSPDGKQMVYLMAVAGREQMFIANADGSGVRQLTRDDVDHEDPAWSPDGKRIAYVHMQDGTQTIHVVDIDGGNDERLTDPKIHVIHPRWHPDGTRLAFCTTDDLDPPRKNAADILVLDLRTHALTTLVTGGINTYPAWSPDGTQIAFRKFTEGDRNSEVFVADADGTHLRNLTNDPAFDGWPAWSPDGRRIAFASNRNNSNYRIHVMDADGTNVRVVARTEGRATAPTWTPDGAAIAFTNCWSVASGTDCDIFVARLPPTPR
jgi:TolB protein